MSARFLLDSNVISDYGNDKPWAGKILQKISLYGLHRCHVSAVTWHELTFGLGALGGKRRAGLSALYASYQLVPFDRAAAIASAQVRIDLGSKGIGLADALIAGQAMAGGFVLVSNNAKQFSRVSGLDWVNWAV